MNITPQEPIPTFSFEGLSPRLTQIMDDFYEGSDRDDGNRIYDLKIVRNDFFNRGTDFSRRINASGSLRQELISIFALIPSNVEEGNIVFVQSAPKPLAPCHTFPFECGSHDLSDRLSQVFHGIGKSEGVYFDLASIRHAYDAGFILSCTQDEMKALGELLEEIPATVTKGYIMIVA